MRIYATVEWHRAMWIFYRKHRAPNAAFLERWLPRPLNPLAQLGPAANAMLVLATLSGALLRARAVPLLAQMKAWLLQTRVNTANGGALAKAIDYSLRRWEALSGYANSGHLPIDNNPIENAIRPIAIGKKNWLFAGSERAGKRAAAIQSLFATAKRNHLDPHAWLKDVLEKLPTWPNRRIDELLPWNWKAAKEAEAESDMPAMPEPPGMMAGLKLDDAKSKKQEPLPTTVLGRYAKVLLSSNEFLFVD